MKKSIGSRSLRIYLGFAVFVLTLVSVIFAGAQNSAKHPSPPSTKSDEPSEFTPFPQADPDATSLRNALRTSENHISSGPSVRQPFRADKYDLPRSEMNRQILKMIEEMPAEGEYHATRESMEKLAAAIRLKGDALEIDCKIAKPSFCSSATYLLFVSLLEKLNENKKFSFKPGVAEKLLVTGQHDGVGVWGRWNANGPGTARLFEELDLGTNFTSLEEAEAGDFLKIFWNDQIGSKEFGHSVVYLGRGINGSVIYWSSNKKGGYGCAEVPLSKIKRTLFSRLTNPEHINRIRDGIGKEDYLASMLERSSTPEKMYEMVGIKASTAADPAPAPSSGKEIKSTDTDLKAGREKQK
jgi:hypothetical protein